MAPNQHRSTAGKTLIAFSLFAAVIAAFSLYLRYRAEPLPDGGPRDEYAHFPTGLGDQELYTANLGPGYDIFFPNLVFEQMPEELKPGLYRRNHQPMTVDDDDVRRFAREKGNRLWVYVNPSPSGDKVRYFLKAGDGQYIQFGEQKYFPHDGDERPGVLPGTTAPDVMPIPND